MEGLNQYLKVRQRSVIGNFLVVYGTQFFCLCTLNKHSPPLICFSLMYYICFSFFIYNILDETIIMKKIYKETVPLERTIKLLRLINIKRLFCSQSHRYVSRIT